MAQVAVGRVPRGPGIRMGNRQPDQKLIGKKCVFFLEIDSFRYGVSYFS